MKKITTTITLIFTTFVLGACSASKVGYPSQNSALNSVSNSTQEKSGIMQSSLDGWLEKDWTPTIEKDPVIKEKYADEKRKFTLQEYVEKAEAYSKESNSSVTESNVEKLNTLPAIGK
jgi:hypothetical protein